MKTTFVRSLSISLVLILFASILDAQVVNTKSKEYKKAVKERTKQLEKDGYKSKGAGTISLYIKNAINYEFSTDENGEKTNPMIYTSALDPTFEGAATACRAAARAALAGNIETNVGELVKRSLNSEQISAKSAEGINQIVTAGKQLIAQKVSMQDVYTFYREVKDERDGKTLIEVEFAGMYSNKLAMQKAREYIREQMKDEAEELHKDLDRIFDLN